MTFFVHYLFQVQVQLVMVSALCQSTRKSRIPYEIISRHASTERTVISLSLRQFQDNPDLLSMRQNELCVRGCGLDL